MTRTIAVATTFALALSTVGCGHVEVSQAVLRQPGPTTGKVDIYMAGQEVKQPYYDVAIVQAVGSGDSANAEDILAALTKRAALLGCDAVVRVQIDQGYVRAHASGVCVKFLSGPAAGEAALPPSAAPPGGAARRTNPSAPLVRPAPMPSPEAPPAAIPGGAW